MDLATIIGLIGLLVAIVGLAYVQTGRGGTLAGDVRRSAADRRTRIGRRVQQPKHRHAAAIASDATWVTYRDPVLERLGVPVRWIGYRPDQPYLDGRVRMSHVPDHWGLPDGGHDFYGRTSVDELVARSRGIEPDLAARSVELVKQRLDRTAPEDRSHFFNGRTVRLRALRPIELGPESSPGLEVHTSVSNYYTGWAGFELVRAAPLIADRTGLPSDRWSRNIAVSGYLVTADDRLVYTKRSQFVARNAGKFGPTVSGDMNPEEDATPSGPSPFRAIARECEEEVGPNIGPSGQPPDWKLEGIAIYDAEEQPVFVFHADVPETMRQVRASSGKDREFEHGGASHFPSFSVEGADLKEVAREIVDAYQAWEAVSLAALLMFLRRRHGPHAVDEAFALAMKSWSRARPKAS